MKGYTALVSAHFRTLLQYRAAALAGLGTQLFWGLIRVMIFEAFYSANVDAIARFLDGTETSHGTSSYDPHDVEVVRDGCANNNPIIEDSTVFKFRSMRVPLVNIQVNDAGDNGEYYGSNLTDNPAWLR